MTITITDIETHDVSFPTSSTLDGSDAVNVDPDYSAAYVILRTDRADLEGHGLTFTNGRGNAVFNLHGETVHLNEVVAEIERAWPSASGTITCADDL